MPTGEDPEALANTRALDGDLGWIVVAALLSRAYSFDGDTNTATETVSNNVLSFREPRPKTRELTMSHTAPSLAVPTGEIIRMYLLRDAHHVETERSMQCLSPRSL